MNHVLQSTQLKFKLDPLMELKILGLVPSEVANLWTLHDPRADVTHLKKEKEKGFQVLGKFVPMENSFV